MDIWNWQPGRWLRVILGAPLLGLMATSMALSGENTAGISYVPPLLGAAGVVVGAGSRGASVDDLALCALAPEHVGLSTRPTPTLYWFSSRALPVGPRLTLGVAGSASLLLDTTLPAVSSAGIHRLPLAMYAVVLREEVDYRWELSLPSPRDDIATNLVVSGYLRYRQPSPAFTSLTDGVSGAELPVIYAGAGYWYDAIWLLSELIRANPDEPRFRAQRLAMLETVPLPVVIAYDQAHRP